MENLDQLVARKRHETGRWEKLSVADVTPSVRDLGQFIGTGREDLSVIVELRRSDRFGRFPARADLDLVELALRLDDADVEGVCIGTDQAIWGADLDDVRAVSEACQHLPILRRDILLTPEDVYASRLAGADAILLLPTIIDDFTMHELAERARTTHMTAVAECWDEKCVVKALDADIRVLSLTAWDEEGRHRDLARIERLAAQVPRHVSVLASGGLSAEEVRRLEGKVDGVLVGEVVLGAEDPVEALARVRGER